MKSPLRVGALRAPKNQLPTSVGRPRAGKARRIASLSAAAAMVVGVGAASALFVDYLADRALARAAEAPVVVKPAVAKAVETPAETKVASIAAGPVFEAAAAPAQPQPAPIEAAMPDPAAVAKVAAVGPEHAIELPADDPTASPIVRLGEASAGEDEPVMEAAVEDDVSDQTMTAAIAPDEAEPEASKPKKTKAAKTKPAQAQPAETEIASLPGVDVGGLAGHPSDDDDSDSTARTVSKPAKANGGGVAAGAARVTAAVNLRSSPKKGASVLTVVPASSTVNVLSCDGWCQVTYNGQKGWVYKNFLAASAARAKPEKQQANSAPAAEPDEPAQRKGLSSRL